MISKGSKGSQVKGIQTALKNAGYNIIIDGIFGPATDKIVRLFQRDHNITVDGKVGPVTMRKLAQVVKERRNAKKSNLTRPIEPKSTTKVVIPIKKLEDLHPEDIDLLIVHHTAGPSTDNSIIIDKEHRNRPKDPFVCIGYHKVALANGRMENGRPINKKGAHTYALNDRSLGIVVVGNFHDHEPSEEQLRLVANQLKYWRAILPKAKIIRHSDGPKYNKNAHITECPGNKFPWAKLIKMVVS